MNRALWDELAALHEGRRAYGRDRLEAGESTLTELDRDLLGDVRGRCVLHAMCHVGIDTASLAREGARVVGLDFSAASIAAATHLFEDLGLEGRFILSEATSRRPELIGRFDVVYASYGIIEWLPDLAAFFAACSSYLKPNGRLVVIDAHPLAHSLMCDRNGALSLVDSYFSGPEPERCRTNGSYADRTSSIQSSHNYKWRRSIAEILSSVLAASFTLTAFVERPVLHYRKFPAMVRRGEWFELPDGPRLPLLFGVRAEKRGSSLKPVADAREASITT